MKKEVQEQIQDQTCRHGDRNRIDPRAIVLSRQIAGDHQKRKQAELLRHAGARRRKSFRPPGQRLLRSLFIARRGCGVN